MRAPALTLSLLLTLLTLLSPLGLGACKDGCTQKGTKPARCIEGICTRIGRDDKPDASCTRKLLWFYTP